MLLMRTAVKAWRCPCSFLYCFLRLKWKTRILSPRPSLTTVPSTFPSGVPTIGDDPSEKANTFLNSTALPTSAATFSILTTSPGATRYCLPPVRITAYIKPPNAITGVINLLGRYWIAGCAQTQGNAGEQIAPRGRVGAPFLWARRRLSPKLFNLTFPGAFGQFSGLKKVYPENHHQRLQRMAKTGVYGDQVIDQD